MAHNGMEGKDKEWSEIKYATLLFGCSTSLTKEMKKNLVIHSLMPQFGGVKNGGL